VEAVRGDRPLILFYEPNPLGHHFAYLARMLPGFLEQPVRSMLVTSDWALDTEEYGKTLGPLASRLEIQTLRTARRRSRLGSTLRALLDIRVALRRFRPNHACIMWGDGVLIAANFLRRLGIRIFPRGMSVQVWLYAGRFVYPNRYATLSNRLKRRLLLDALNSGYVDAVNVDDDLLYQWLVEHVAPTCPARIVLTPNPVLTSGTISEEEARRRLGLPLHSRIISITGGINTRKGADLLIRAFARHLELTGAAEDCLLLGGPHQPAIRQLLAEAPYRDLAASGRIVSLDRFLTETDMADCTAAGDLIVAPYPNHAGRSSIAIWAAAFGKPCLGTAGGCLGYMIETNRLGYTCGVTDIDRFAGAIGEAMEAEWTADDAARVRRYAELHSFENYQRVSCEFVRQRYVRSSGDDTNARAGSSGVSHTR
jgi:glycosyltransferase involved in cell wall biosynthesis